MTNVPNVTLNNGVAMPQVGFGVFKIPDAETEAAVTTALRAGYRSIDTAALYRNEKAVGKAIAAAGLPRDDLFVTTKVWNTDQGYDQTLRAFETSAAMLGLATVDLYLIHWPAAARDQYVDSWKALGRLYADGRVRAIGVSNFQPEHLRQVIDATGTVPAVNQIELHPWLQQAELRELHAELGVVTEAWGPLARGGDLLADQAVTGIAAKHGRTPAQVVLRWHLQLGNVIIPKSVTPARVSQNLALFDFELDELDMAGIAALDSDHRTGPHPDDLN